MLMQPTIEKLHSMKLAGMADAIRAQNEDPEIIRLSFEERLALLVDHQWDWLQNKAFVRRLKNARFKTSAAVEDIDYRHPRRLDRGLIRSLSSCDWVRHHQNLIVTGPCGVGKSYIAGALAQKAVREDSLLSMYALRVCFAIWLWPVPMEVSAGSWIASPASMCFSSMIGPWLLWPTASAATFWKSVMTAIRRARPFLPARCRSLNGTIKSAILRSPTASSTVWSTTLTASSCRELPCAKQKPANTSAIRTSANDSASASDRKNREGYTSSAMPNAAYKRS